MGDLPEAIDNLDLIDTMYTWGKSAVHAEDLVIDDDGQRQEIKHVGEVVPDIGVAVFAAAFGVEPVRLRNAARFVISADEMDAVRVP